MKKEGIAGIIIIFTVCVMLTGAAWGEVGVTDKEIKIGTHMALTGPAAVVCVPIRNGLKNRVDEVNELGGIHGRKINFIAEDDQFLPSRAKEVARKLIYKDKIFCTVQCINGTGIVASMPDINKNKVPFIFVGSSLDALFNPTNRYIFGWTIPYYDAACLMVDWAVKELGKKRLAFVNMWGPIGDSNYKGASEQLKRYGLDLVMGEKLKNVKMDYSGLVAKMRARKVDFVAITTTAQWTIPLLKEIERQGWDVDVIIGHSSSNIPMLKKLAGEHAIEGAHITMAHLPTDSDDPYMVKYRQNLRKYGDPKEQGFYNFIGYGLMGMLLDTIDSVGPNLTRERLIDKLESWKDYDTKWAGKISYGPDDHIGQEGLIIVKIVDGKVKVLKNRAYPKKF
ncbi:ABC transporter substrate-binding protein [Thermodesulfobacteriota bacterium]